MDKTEKRSTEEHKRWVIATIVKINPRITKEAAKAAYDFAEIILGEPVCSPDDTTVTGFLAGTKYAAQERDKARNQAIDDVIKRLSVMVHYGNIDLSWSFIKEEIEQLKTKP